MSGKTRHIHYLKDYLPPAFLVDHVELHFLLNPEETIVRARIEMRRNPDFPSPPLNRVRLEGRDLELISLKIDTHPLSPHLYQLDDEGLTLITVPDHFILETVTRIYPRRNTSLEGLYCSGEILCTQCEPEGFRKITYFPDRPDVMACYTVTLEAEEGRYTNLLANGNLVKTGVTELGNRFSTWSDPFKKPSYLFALVAGNLALSKDRFTTCSGRVIDLHLYVEPENHDACRHALNSLKKAMLWDETRFGREYDLDLYMIVAVSHFNMGAMENKGLNLFNAKYVLALPQTATDLDFQQIESVIAHEYFHNWTGNRITCRDWFQLSLKEGLTVFRDQEYSAEEVTTPGVQRVGDVRLLRTNQFAEDSGPTAHPVQPDSYMEINNFYTVTIYNKGAEVVRMLAVMLGREGFRRGMDLYFARHDGQAVTVEAFLRAMEDSSGRDLSQFSLWYRQSGTPVVTVREAYDPETHRYELHLGQHCPATPGQKVKAPFHIPVSMALLNLYGQAIPLKMEGEGDVAATTRLLELTQAEQTFRFLDVACKPVVSLFRNFSAPIRLDFKVEDAALAFLWRKESDGFNQWEGGQAWAKRLLFCGVEDWKNGKEFRVDELFIHSFREILLDVNIPDTQKALLLTLPDERYLLEEMQEAEPEGVHVIRERLKSQVGQSLGTLLLETYHGLSTGVGGYRYTREDAGKRGLKNLCLDYLLTADREAHGPLAVIQYQQADNMTDRLTAITQLTHKRHGIREELLADFYGRWRHDPLVMDKWFAIQATSPQPDTLARVEDLLHHALFTLSNPNRVRSLTGAFCQGNPVCFHDPSGQGYDFLVSQVTELNAINPQLAARMLTALTPWRRFEPHRREKMLAALHTLTREQELSRDVHEILTKTLEGESLVTLFT